MYTASMNFRTAAFPEGTQNPGLSMVNNKGGQEYQLVSGMQVLDVILSQPENQHQMLLAQAKRIFGDEVNPFSFYLNEDFEWFMDIIKKN